MRESPDVDGRRREALREHVEAIAPYYTDAWSPESDDPGTALLALFAEMAEDVVERLDQVPEKHQIAFFDTLGFSRQPPQPARLPLSFQIADGAGQNVVIDGGTQAVAAATDSRPEQTFEIPAEQRFEATPANLAAVYSVDPTVDGIYNHWDPPEGIGLSRGGEPSLFTGRNRQKHVLYIGHVDQLNVTSDARAGKGNATIRVELTTETARTVFGNRLRWEYYGEWTVDGESMEGWHPVTKIELDNSPSNKVILDLELDGAPTETTVSGVESRWIRVSVPQDNEIENFAGLQLGTSVLVGPGLSTEQNGANGGPDRDGSDKGPTMHPNRLFYNDVPLPFGTADETDDGEPDGQSTVGARNESGNVDATADGEMPPYYPLGTAPHVQDTFYIASNEVFTKSGARAKLTFEGLTIDPDNQNISNLIKQIKNNQPQLSWEYWNGDGWVRIDDLEDETNFLTGKSNINDETNSQTGESNNSTVANTVTFSVPENLQKTTVSGHDGHWIRCRLVGGNYGKWTAKKIGDKWETTHIVHPPQFNDLTITYEPSPAKVSLSKSKNKGPPGQAGSSTMAEVLPLKAATHLFAENNLTYSDNLVESDRQQVSPFEPLPDEKQTLYLGFDDRLHDGPITLFFETDDRAYPNDFHSRIRWEYCADSANGEWIRLDVQDGTEGLTEWGIVNLVFPGETVPCRRFDTEFHWIRARVTGDPFEPSVSRVPIIPEEIDSLMSELGHKETSEGIEPIEPCGLTLETEPPSGGPTKRPPTVSGISPNTGWAYNVRSIENETVGSSDGTQSQVFVAASSPVIDETVWVDELPTLSKGDRRELREAETPAVETTTGNDGSLRAFWVKWQEVPDFLDSGEGDRHYTVDRTAGKITFGNGSRGRIPPRGQDNVRISYRTGGGPDGNVDVGAVAELKSSLQFVDNITNPAPGTGGAAAESTNRVMSRASKQLRDRNRAVTEVDYERIAMDAARRLARVKCIPGMNRAGESASGWITLLLVPNAPRTKPVPSTGLKEKTRVAVGDRAPATLIAADRLVVRGPSYVRVSVETDMVAEGRVSVGMLEGAVTDEIEAFLHPLSGGEDGNGWAFGELPTMSDLYALLEGIDRIDHVTELSMRFETSEAIATLREGEELPSISADALIYSGTHEVTVGLGAPATETELEGV